jgi:hypothetical protein
MKMTTDAVKMKPAIKKRWLAWLRDPENKQSSGFLQDANGFCCLGGLCELAVDDGIIEKRVSYTGIWEYDGRRDYLPDKVAAWAGLFNEDGKVVNRPAVFAKGDISKTSLDTLNDDGVSFSEIARLIDKHL